MRLTSLLLVLTLPVSAGAATAERLDLIVRGGTVYDGTGAAGRRADVGVRADRIAAVGDLSQAQAARVIDATGLAVAPGFINMLSWATDSLLVDGRSMSDIKQGVTLEVFGEGWSMGPLNDAMKEEAKAEQGDIKYDITWTTLGEYLEHLVARGISPNVASFVGATTLRIHELGYADRAPTPEELARMQDLARQAMREGALGLGAALIYTPAFYAKPDELLALTNAVAESGGGYVAHLRSESNRFLEAADELIGIARDAKVHGEIYHLKAAGQANWPKMAQAIARVEAARAAGVSVSANMYTYVAGATGLNAAMPPWVQEGGLDAWVQRLQNPAIRARVIAEMRTPTDAWENLWMMAGSPDRVKLIGFKTDMLKPLTGMTLAQVMEQRGASAEDTMIDLVIEDHTRVDAAYFLMSEDNVRLGISQPWVTFGSDAESSAPEGVFLQSSTHPRAYGNFARLLGRYVRDEKVIALPEAIRRLTRLPAENWQLEDRGCLDAGCYADLVVFDPATIQDHATFEQPRQYATGVRDVFVNGVQVLRNGEHTGEKPGRVVRGPGWRQADAAVPSQPIPDVAMQWGVKIPMRDGVLLNATLYRGRATAEPVPCLFTLTPYVGQSYHDRAMHFASHGYVYLTVDVRGRGNSGGDFTPLLQEARDGHDVVEWLARQPCCNGKVSMWGGSYAGYDQWAAAKEFPPHLATIVPVAAPYAGVDFPMSDNMFYAYDIQWLTFTAGHASQAAIFGDAAYWTSVYKKRYLEHTSFRALDALAGMPSPAFQTWLKHPMPDAYWDSYNPTEAQYAKIDMPILTITGIYDGDQLGALEHYRLHMKNASPSARAKHFLIIGPWDHAGTRTPQPRFGGLEFGPASLLDMNALHVAWYDWTMKSGPKPEFLKAPVAYYLPVADEWRHSESLGEITAETRPMYLDSTASRANDVFASGSLGASPGKGGPDRYLYDPIDTSAAWLADDVDAPGYTDQRGILANGGKSLIYHSAPFDKDTDLAGFFQLTAFIAIDHPDTDLTAAVYDIAPDGSSVFLAGDAIRARYRESPRAAKLATPGRIERYQFDSFTFAARRVAKAHRLRLVIGPADSPGAQKNYNSGGEVSDETAKDARTVTVTLYHDDAHRSALYLPVAKTK